MYIHILHRTIGHRNTTALPFSFPPSPTHPLTLHNLPVQIPKKARSFPNREYDRYRRRGENPAESDDHPSDEETLREDVV